MTLLVILFIYLLFWFLSTVQWPFSLLCYLKLLKVKDGIISCSKFFTFVVFRYCMSWNKLFLLVVGGILSTRYNIMGDEIIHCCTMCNYIADNFNQFTNHISRIHRNNPRFRVYGEFGDWILYRVSHSQSRLITSKLVRKCMMWDSKTSKQYLINKISGRCKVRLVSYSTWLVEYP